MSLWIVLALMTIAAMAAVVWPLARFGKVALAADPNDVAVYRDQLAEIERDKASGIIAAAEADAARIEVSRRLLAAADRLRGGTAVGASKPPQRRIAAAGALVALPIGAIAFYLAIGSPGLPDEPLSARIAAVHNDNSVQALFARVEAHLEQHPDDGRGWEVIAPIYMDLGRYDEAVKARGNALRLLGATAAREAYYGEALTAAANGVVTAEAKTAFDRAIDRDPRDPTARFYQGLAAEQDGSRDDALRIWRALLADAPADAPWAAFVRTALARLDGSAPPAVAAPPPAAGSAGDNAMIRGMVERLAARLQQDGSDADGWVRLVRSYKVLGDNARTDAAIADARRALAPDAGKLATFEEALRNIDSTPASPSPPPAAAAEPAEQSADQDRMIRGMVERLAARLRQDGSDVNGWIMLVRSYLVLGEHARAQDAVAAAHAALDAKPDDRQRFEDGLKALGMTQQGKVQ